MSEYKMPGTHHGPHAPAHYDPTLFGRLKNNPNNYSTLAIDIETYSSVDLRKAGVYAYVESPDFEVLMMAYKFNLDPIKIVDLASGETIPLEVLAKLDDPYCKKIAYNAAFERTCLAEWLQRPMLPTQWHCTMARGLLAGFPAGLEAISKALGLGGKDKEGTRLINMFSKPQKPSKKNGMVTRIYPEFAPEDWEKYKAYCIRDVEAEEAVRKAVPNYMSERESRVWTVDQMINDRGVLIDRCFVQSCVAQKREYSDGLFEKSVGITRLDNPGSVKQLGAWVGEHLGVEVESMAKDKMGDLIAMAKELGDSDVVAALELRAESSLSSLAKYGTMLKMVCNDERIRGLFQYAGASRTHRWAGRGVQLQNLRKNSMKDLFGAREIVRRGDLESTEMLYGDVADVLSQLIRTSFIATPGSKLLVADYSAIEARIIAWLAGEQWRIDVFAGHGMIYEASAAAMFGVPLESIAKMVDGEKVKGPNYGMRAKGKVAELACGYQGGPNALLRMGAAEMGLKTEELQPIINAWRAASPRIVALWKAVEACAKKCVQTGYMQSLRCLTFRIEGTALTITLPSGRKLCYQSPVLRANDKGGQSLWYMGTDEGKNWGHVPTYGGKLVENIVQSIARDCLAEALIWLTVADYKIVMHIHDEVVIEAPEHDGGTLDDVVRIMCQPMPWAPDLLLAADGYETKYYYKKD